MKVIYEKHQSIRRKPINLKEKDTVLFQHEFEREIKETHLVSISNGLILSDIIVHPFNPGKYIPYCLNSSIGYKSILKRLFQIKGFKKTPKGVWIIDSWSAEYFHWMTDALPRLLASHRMEKNFPVLLPHGYSRIQYVTESLKLLKKEVLYYDPSKALLVKNLLVPSHTALTGNYNHNLINELRHLFVKDITSKPTRKVFISRLKASRRKILNEDEVVEFLKTHNWEIHYFEEYSFRKQQEIMSETKYLISLHGAGLTNMLFMKEGGKVLELRNKNDRHNNCYFALASELNLDYYYQLNSGSSFITHIANITVDIQTLQDNVDLMES